MKKQKGFTLIELLMVVVILSILSVSTLVVAPSLYFTLNTRFFTQQTESKFNYYVHYAENYNTPVDIEVSPNQIDFSVEGTLKESFKAPDKIQFETSTNALQITPQGKFDTSDWNLTVKRSGAGYQIQFNSLGIVR